MRFERSITSVSWIPSDLLEGMGRLATRMKIAHHDPPPPDAIGPDIARSLDDLRAADRFRFANHLRAFVETDDHGAIVDCGYTGAGMIGATTVGLGAGSITIPALAFTDRTSEPEHLDDGGVRFTQTAGGRTGAPMPRKVSRPPFVQYHAPTVWTTLELTIHADGSHTGAMVGASGFPRHWVFDDGGLLVAKSSLAEYKRWMKESFGRHTPWGDEDSPALVSEVESLLEKELQESIIRGGTRPEIGRVKTGDTLLRQGDPSDGRLYLLLNGLLAVEVDGEPLAEIGPGAVFGERAHLDGGRTATLRALTDSKFAAAPLDTIDPGILGSLADQHRREDERNR